MNYILLCLTFLLYNFIAGVFVFLILGIFAVTNNPFLIIMNLKEKDGKKEYNSDERKHALLQYFIAAIFSLFFGFIIFICCSKKFLSVKDKKEIKHSAVLIISSFKIPSKKF